MAWRVGSNSGAHMFVANIMLTMAMLPPMAICQHLAGQNIVAFNGAANALIDRVVAGEYAITLTVAQHLPIIAASKGAPVAAYPLQPMPSAVASINDPQGDQESATPRCCSSITCSRGRQTVLRDGQYFPTNSDVQPLKGIVAGEPAPRGTEGKLHQRTRFSTKLRPRLKLCSRSTSADVSVPSRTGVVARGLTLVRGRRFQFKLADRRISRAQGRNQMNMQRRAFLLTSNGYGGDGSGGRRTPAGAAAATLGACIERAFGRRVAQLWRRSRQQPLRRARPDQQGQFHRLEVAWRFKADAFGPRPEINFRGNAAHGRRRAVLDRRLASRRRGARWRHRRSPLGAQRR